MNTTEFASICFSRLNDFQIVVALDVEQQSKGDLFWDDGDTIGKLDFKIVIK